jgi:CheY-like chemotaxis protein/two-component sensor histidine kinase
LRNPLAPIRNATVLLQHFAATDPNLMKIGEMIGRQSAHLARLLDDLLDVSRITRGKITLRREPLDTEAIARDALEFARPVMELRRHEVRLNLPSKRLWVQGDATRLAQVLGNLLINAGKYTPVAGEITLALEGTTEHVIYRVRDNGVGIDAELLPRVFELFSQADRTLDRTEGGLGIGLAVVKSIVEMHGGSVAAVSEGQGKGAEFIIRLPRLEYVEVEQEKAREQSVLPSAPQRVLVADDNSDLAESVAMLLRFEGHEVRIALDGPSALELAEEFKPDAALLDIGLPGLNGYELARKLRSRSSGQKLLLIAVTGYGRFKDRERSKNAGFDCHLVKPVDPHALSVLLKKRHTD